MTEQDIDNFEKAQAQLESLHQEISILSKKSQNEAINLFKLKFVNKTIQTANELLGEKYKPFDDFSQFSQDDLPTNSDVTMILAQYLNCLEKLRSDNIIMSGGRWFWLADGKESKIKTIQPQKLGK